MIGTLRALTGVALLTVGILAAPAIAQEATLDVTIDSSDTGQFPEVRLFVQVTDVGGRPLRGLGPEVFAVTVDGQPVTKLDVAQETPGSRRLLNVVLAIDVSQSMLEPRSAPAIEAAREGLLGFLETVSGLGKDAVKVSVVTFGEKVRPLEGESIGDLKRAARDLKADQAETHLYDAVRRSVEIAGRDAEAAVKAVVVLTDGRDEGRAPGEPGSDITIDELVDRLDGSVRVYTIGVGDSPDEDALRRIAEASGGTSTPIRSPADLPGEYERLAKELPPVFYRLAFSVNREPATAERSVVVTVTAGAAKGTDTAPLLPPGATRPEERKIDWTLIALAVLGLLVVVLLIIVLTSRSDRPKPGPVVPSAPWLGPAFVAGGYRFPINAPEMSIGRDPSTDICIAEPSVSRIHARIMMSPEGLLLEDLNSSNGTFVNDEPVRAVYLQDGDSVAFGTVQLLFQGQGV